MEEKKKIGSSYGFLVIILFAVVCFLTVYIITNRKAGSDCASANNSSSNTSQNASTNNDVNNTNNANSNVNEGNSNANNDDAQYDFKGATSFELLSCNYGINASIVDGNIVIDNGSKKITLKTNNAKYMYQNGFMECGTTFLYFIDSDGNLFKINNAYSFMESDEYKNGDVINSFIDDKLADNATQFLGEGYKMYENYGFSDYYLSIYTNNNTVQNETYKLFYYPSY